MISLLQLTPIFFPLLTLLLLPPYPFLLGLPVVALYPYPTRKRDETTAAASASSHMIRENPTATPSASGYPTTILSVPSYPRSDTREMHCVVWP